MYYKITNQDENHHGFQYKNGMNILIEPFVDEGSCIPGGLYFTGIENILHFVRYGVYLREVTLPTNDIDFKMVVDKNKWRANKIIFGKKYDLRNINTWKYLEKNGADINKHVKYVLRWAVKNNFFNVLRYLINKGIDINVHNGYAIRTAVQFNHLKIVVYLLDNGADVNINNGGPLQIAAEDGNMEITHYLVEKGADVCADNNLAIQLAAQNGQLEMVHYLVEKGADITDNNNEAIALAAAQGHIEVVRYLIEKGANISTNDALNMARENNHTEIVNLLTFTGHNF